MRGDGHLDPPDVLCREGGALAAKHGFDQLDHEGLAVRIKVDCHERRAAGRATGLEIEIGAARGANENLGPVVLVEEHTLGPEFFQLREQEGLHHRLAGAGGAADEGVAQIADMEVEVEGASGAGLELADRIAPFVAVPVAGRVIVQRRHGRVVTAGYHRHPRPVRVVAGKLRPELRLKPHVFTGDDSSGFRQEVMRICGAGFQLLGVIGQDGQ